MPFKNKEDYNAYNKVFMREYRKEVLSEDEAYKEKEKERKAKWYAENKEKKAEAQRRYRARKKEENL